MSDELRSLFAADGEGPLDVGWRAESAAQRGYVVPSLPLRPQQFIGFTRLLDSLAGIRGGDTFALIAPMGYGKTSLLAQWASMTGRQCCLLPLPVDVAEANALLADLLARLNPTAFKVKQRFEGPGELPAVALEALEDPRAVIALDDVHHATDPTTAKLLVSVINHLPGHRVLALAGRRLPQMRQRDLQNPHKVTQLTFRELGIRRTDLNELEEEGWPAPVLDKVLQLSGGWPAGVRQTIEWFADHRSTVGEPRDWCLSEFYQQEVLEALPAELGAFLGDVSVVGGADSTALDWARQSTDSADHVRALRELSLPLVSTDLRSTPWISLHSSLAADLAQRVEPTKARLLASRAAGHFDRSGEYGEAFNLLMQLGDKSAAVEFLGRQLPPLVLKGEAELVRSWLDQFSPGDLFALPELQLLRAMLAGMEGEPGTVLTWLEMFESSAKELLPTDEKLAERYSLLRQAMGIDPMDEGVAKPLRDDDLWTVGTRLITAYRAAYRGEFAVAETSFQAVAPFSRPHPLMEIWRVAGLVWVYWETGRRAMGYGLMSEAAQMWREYGLTSNPTTTQFECLMAYYALEAHDHKQAKWHFDNARAKLASLHSALTAERLCATLMLIEVARGIGEESAAETLCGEAEQLARGATDAPHLIAIMQRAEAAGGERSPAGGVQLSRAELKILRFLPSHYTVPQIAKSLYLSPATVRTQVQAIYRKLGAHHRAEAVEIARASGLID